MLRELWKKIPTLSTCQTWKSRIARLKLLLFPNHPCHVCGCRTFTLYELLVPTVVHSLLPLLSLPPIRPCVCTKGRTRVQNVPFGLHRVALHPFRFRVISPCSLGRISSYLPLTLGQAVSMPTLLDSHKREGESRWIFLKSTVRKHALLRVGPVLVPEGAMCQAARGFLNLREMRLPYRRTQFPKSQTRKQSLCVWVW